MRSLGEVRLPSLRPAGLSNPTTKADLERSMNYTWTSVLYEIPNVGRKRGAKTSKYVKDNDDARRLSQLRAPRTPKTPIAGRSVRRLNGQQQPPQRSAHSQRVPPKTPTKVEVRCRHKNSIKCKRCAPDDVRHSKRRTPRPTPLHYTPRSRSNAVQLPADLQLRLPPIQRSYSIAALRKQKEAASGFLHDLKSTFPRSKNNVSRSNSVAALQRQDVAVSGALRRSRSVNSVADHVARLIKSRSVQSIYGVRGPNIPLHLTRSHSVNSLPTAHTNHRSRSLSRGNIGNRSGRSRSHSVARGSVSQRSTRPRSRSLSTVRVMPMTSGRPTASRSASRDQARAQSRQPSRDSTRSKTTQKAVAVRTRSISKTRSSGSNRRNFSRDHSIPVVVRLTKTPSAPDIYRTSSRLSINSNDGNRKKFPLFMAIKPENQKTEKEKFFRSNFTYSPMFSYAAPASDSQLQKYSRASDRLMHLAVSIMQNAIRRFGTYEKYMELTGGRKLSRYEIIQAAKNYLKDENMEDEVDISISEDLLSRARMSMIAGRPTVIVRAHNMREHWVDGMLKHEIGTHYMRAWNNKLQVWGSAKKRKEHHLEPANPTEEGLASLHSIIYRKDPCLWRCAMLYYTIYQATRMSFAEVFNDLGRFVKDPEVRWEYCLRAKRGQFDTSIPGAFCKDQVYLNGALQLLKHIQDIDFHLLVRCGKVSYRDLPRLEAIGPDLDRTRIPTFMSDQAIYKKELERIMNRNGLTQEALDILP